MMAASARTTWVLCILAAIAQPGTASLPLHAPFDIVKCNSSSVLQKFVITRVNDTSYIALTGSDNLCLDAACPKMKNCRGATPHTAKCSEKNPNQKWILSSSGQTPWTTQIAHLAIEQAGLVCLAPSSSKRNSVTSLTACGDDTTWNLSPTTSDDPSEYIFEWTGKPRLCLALSSSPHPPGPSPPSAPVLTCHDRELASLPFCNQSLPPKMRVADLLPRMKLEDKIAMLHGGTSLPNQKGKVYSGETARNAGAVSLCARKTLNRTANGTMGSQQMATTVARLLYT